MDLLQHYIAEEKLNPGLPTSEEEKNARDVRGCLSGGPRNKQVSCRQPITFKCCGEGMQSESDAPVA